MGCIPPERPPSALPPASCAGPFAPGRRRALWAGGCGRPLSADASFKKALGGEKEIAALERQPEAKKATPEQAKPAWQALLKKYEDTCLAARLKGKVE